MSVTEANFVRIEPEVWRLNKCMTAKRKQELLNGPMFEEIIQLLSKEATIIEHAREKCRSQPEYFRINVIIKVASRTIDLFHNSAAGYRAQFFSDPEIGTKANKYALEELIPKILENLKGTSKRTCQENWAKTSLANAKLWIYQGTWLRHNKREERNLNVERWLTKKNCSDMRYRKNAFRSTLTPSQENRLVVKGEFFKLETSEPLDSLKPNRAVEIHECGFT